MLQSFNAFHTQMLHVYGIFSYIWAIFGVNVGKYSSTMEHLGYTLWLFNIAMENGSFIDGLPITNGDFPWLC
jgi:hypothetical protein